jgi:trans-aconitate methyltransferase
VFSTATVHWIADHEGLFRSVFEALGPGGRFVSQCGGGRNLSRLYGRAADLMRASDYQRFFEAWRDPWHFAFPDETRVALSRAGFESIEVWLESTPARFSDPAAYSEFIKCVCIRHHLSRLPPSLHDGFTSQLTAAAERDDPPLTLDYWRLNITARRPAA